MEEKSDNKWLASRIKKSLLYLEKNNYNTYHVLQHYVETYFIPILKGELDQEQENIYFDMMDSILDDLEEIYPKIFK